MALKRIENSETVLEALEERGYNVGSLNWKPPREYRSIKYNQSGFDVDNNTGRTDHATVTFSKIGTFHLNYHRPLPKDSEIKEIILKQKKTGDWTVSIVVEYEENHPEKPDVESITIEDTVGIDLGITKFIHDSNGRQIEPLSEELDRERIEKCHRSLSRKEFESNNWHKTRRKLAEAYERLSNKRRAFRERLANEYTQKYDAIFLEDLNVDSMMGEDGNSRNVASMSWRKMIDSFEVFGEKNGCHIVLVNPQGTTKECVGCGVSSEKPLWVREHSCPSCGFTVDRDFNSSLEVKRRGLVDLGVVDGGDGRELGQELAESTLAETGTSVDAMESSVVSASSVVETRSSVLNERTASAVSE